MTDTASAQAEQEVVDPDRIDEAHTIAQNLARNCGWAVFPCHDDKTPTTYAGFKDASKDAVGIDRLWQRHPGPLIGLATGAVSGVDGLDVDHKHDTARAWWAAHKHRFPSTRVHRTRSGGFHAYFQHHEGLKSSSGRIGGEKIPGIDCRADGGYLIFWFAAGFLALCHEPPAPWPDWVVTELQKPAYEPPVSGPRPSVKNAGNDTRAREAILAKASGAAEGNRNALLFWAAARFKERVDAGTLTSGDAEALLVGAAVTAGLTKTEVTKTALSGLRGAT